jgi:uncharacterized membrane protein YtjA (UPF0391 family)
VHYLLRAVKKSGRLGQAPGLLLGDQIMLYWALMFLVVALIAGALGFFGTAVAAAGIARILFFVFIVLFLISLLTGMRPRGTI